MADDIHVCQFVNSTGPTSIPADIAVGLAKHTDVKSTIISWFDADPIGNDLVEIHQLEASDSFLDRDACARGRRLIDRLDVDLLQTHHNHAGIYAKAIGRREGLPVVRTEQNTHDGYTRVGRISNGLTNPLADRVTCISRAVHDSFEWWERAILPDRKVEIVRNGVDLERVSEFDTVDWSLPDVADVAEESVVLGNAAMCTEQKAQDILIRALAEAVGRTDRRLELVIAGDGALRDELEALTTQLGLDERVHFVGLLNRSAVYRMMDAVDVFCMPSRWEGFCVAVAEAMAIGTACVLSDIDVFRELYGDAAVYHPVDDVDGLAGAIARLAEDGSQRRDLAAAGEALVREQYSLRAVAQTYRDLYERVL